LNKVQMQQMWDQAFQAGLNQGLHGGRPPPKAAPVAQPGFVVQPAPFDTQPAGFGMQPPAAMQMGGLAVAQGPPPGWMDQVALDNLAMKGGMCSAMQIRPSRLRFCWTCYGMHWFSPAGVCARPGRGKFGFKVELECSLRSWLFRTALIVFV
jgi:hypothetical protein